MVETTFSLVDFEYFLLVFARIASFFLAAPFFGQQGIPAMSKIGIAGVTSLMIINHVQPQEAEYFSAVGYGLIVIKEVVCGLLIGYMANICQHIVTYAGNLIDMNMGLTMASQFDPSLNTQVTITGNIYYYFMLMLMLITNMHQYLIKAITDTFTLIPLGSQIFNWDFLVEGMLSFLANMFILAFRIMLPIFATMLVVNIVLGIMAKVAPQMNMFSVGVQIKVIVGVFVLFMMVFLFPEVVELLINEVRIAIRNVVGGLM